MEKRYQVFVSSTYDDLKEERAKVITALLDLGHIPCGMEYFPAADEDAWNCIERLIPQCDYYVVLVAGKYGTVAAGDTISYTQKEYELAVQHQVPVLGLLHGKPEELARKLCEQDPKNQKKLEKFRALVKRRLCRFWTSADQIPGALLASLPHQINRSPRVGWVRADSVASEEAKNEIITLRRNLEKQEKVIEKLKRQQADNEGELASGQDELRLRGMLSNDSFRYRWGDEDDSEEESIKIVKCQFELVSSWDGLLDFIGIKGSKVWSLSELEEWLKSEVSSFVIQLKAAETNVWGHCTVRWDQNEMKKIEIQLTALGLIASRDYYKWTFTQKGILRASRKRALRKGELYPCETSWFTVEIGDEGNAR